MGARRQPLMNALLWAIGLGSLSGCFGVTQNPSYFPRLLPTGDIIRTHAKPPGWGYFTNFDPHACQLEVRPLDGTNPVRTSHVLIAMGADPASARGSLRLSLGHTSTEADVEAALAVLPAAVERARQAALASSGVVD